MNQETDVLEERNKDIDNEIVTFNSLVQLSEDDKLNKLEDMRLRAQFLTAEISKANTDCEDMQGEFSHIQGKVIKMVRAFEKSHFSLSVASHMGYDNNTCFNENNVIPYLAELEEYISSLITFVAYKRDDPNAAVSSVPLEKLIQKDFNKREIAIDAPVDTERDASMMAARTDAGDDDDGIVDSKQLYMKFMDMVGKKQINIVH